MCVQPNGGILSVIIRFFDTIDRVAMAADSTSVSQRGDCPLAFPQLGRYQAEVMLSAARQKGLPEGEKPSVPGDEAELITDEGCIMQPFAER